MNCALLIFVALSNTAARDANPLIRTQEGDMPILISAPHGGSKAIPGCNVRTGKGLEKDFTIVQDAYTEQLAMELSAALFKKTGQKPFFVIASFHRKYVDANRPASQGTESEAGKAVYDDYHNAMKKYTKAIGTKFRGGLILDLHGQATSASTIFRGTQNGKTLSKMKEKFGEQWVDGSDSFFAKLAQNGMNVHPLGTEKENPKFGGGFIVRTYSGYEFPTDAIQLEFGMNHRKDKAARSKTIQAMIPIIAEFAKKYLNLEKNSTFNIAKN